MAVAGHSSGFAPIVFVAMSETIYPALFSAVKHDLWHAAEPSIWSLAMDAPQEDPAQSIMRTLWDQPRWLEAYHLYDDRGAELFEKICELPEYYLTRTENGLLERESNRIIDAAPVACIVELGAGSAKKTVHLLKAQVAQRGSSIFAPIDVSLPGLRASKDFVRIHFPQVEFHGLHAQYEDGFSSISRDLPTLFVFLGSTIGNFNPASFVRFFSRLSHAMGPRDFLLLGADRVKDVDVLERAYNDSRGLTADFILNIFHNINRLTGSNFSRDKMRYDSGFNRQWAQIEMYAVSSAMQEIVFSSFGASFRWPKEDRILVEISRKFDPLRLQQQLSFFDLTPMAHYTDAREWFSLLLFKKVSPEFAKT
ncbi:MAG TPA: L-histidine N(alpha)-methyltransferase [Candidatus Acidoferrales bacterium]|nr:L-histidine N(alpha)-methyltransferase [Candidatus Acidoferrales bacterium]